MKSSKKVCWKIYIIVCFKLFSIPVGFSYTVINSNENPVSVVPLAGDNVDKEFKGRSSLSIINCEILSFSLEDLAKSVNRVLEEPDNSVPGKEHFCTVLSLLKQNDENTARISSLESKFQATQDELTSLTQKVSLHSSQFDSIEKHLEEGFFKVEDNDPQKSTASFNHYKTTKEKVLNNTLQDLESRVLSSEIKLAEVISYTSELTEILLLDELRHKNNDLLGKWNVKTQEPENTFAELSNIMKAFGQLEESFLIQSEDTPEEITQRIENKNDGKIEEELPAELKDNSSQIVNDKVSKNDENQSELKAKLPKSSDNNDGGRDGGSWGIKGQSDLLERSGSWGTKLPDNLDRERDRDRWGTKSQADLLDRTSSSAWGTKQSSDDSDRGGSYSTKNGDLLPFEQFLKLRDQLKFIEQELTMQMKTEAIRAQGREDQLSALITNEIQRAQKVESDIHRTFEVNMYRLTGDLVSEFNRAKSVEEALDKKISREFSRIENAQSGIISNVTSELRRATESTHLLQQQVYSEEAKVRKLELDLRWELQNEVKRSKAADEELGAKLHQQDSRISNFGSELKSELDQEASRSQGAISSLRSALDHEVRRAKEAEAGAMSTMMAEVTRALESEKTLRVTLSNEIDRSKQSEITLQQVQEKTLSNFGGRIENLANQIRSESIKTGVITSDLSRSVNKNFLVLTELSKRFQNESMAIDQRIQALVEELEQCCSSGKGSWFTKPKNKPSESQPQATTRGGVLNRVLGMFATKRVGANKLSAGQDKSDGNILVKNVTVTPSGQKTDGNSEEWDSSEFLSMLDKDHGFSESFEKYGDVAET